MFSPILSSNFLVRDYIASVEIALIGTAQGDILLIMSRTVAMIHRETDVSAGKLNIWHSLVPRHVFG